MLNVDKDYTILKKTTEGKMEVVGAKVVVLILLGLIKLGSGLLPLLLDKVLQHKKVSLSFFPVYPHWFFLQ